MKQLSLFSMVCRKVGDPLHDHAKFILTECSTGCKSWFLQISDICNKYGLQHPLFYLEYPPQKLLFKNQVKSAITEYWHQVLTSECRELKSLKYFRPELYSVLKPHYMWTLAAGMPYETTKSSVLSKMLSGRYRSENFCRHFNPSNREGYCSLPSCSNVPGTLEHILITCPSLSCTRERMYSMFLERTVMFPSLHHCIRNISNANEEIQTQFFLEPLAFQVVKDEAFRTGQQYIRTLSYITRTFVFRIHREYLKHIKDLS